MADLARARAFHQLHHGPEPLVLANCWDAGSARLIESLGVRALATTSAGVAWAAGYRDGNALPVDQLVAAVRSISRVIAVPLTVDAEAGYADDPAAVGDTVAALIDAGAAGINLEDGAGSVELLVAKIERVKQAAARAGVELFVNARTDVYLRGLAPEPARVEQTLARARRYRDAGADGLFVPRLVDPADIRAIAAAAGLPLNVMVVPGLPPVPELAALGVKRVSTGALLPELAYGRVASSATQLLRDGRFELLFDGALPYTEVNALFPKA